MIEPGGHRRRGRTGRPPARDPRREPDLRRAGPAAHRLSRAPDDHVRGDGPVVLEYADHECPYCAARAPDPPRAPRPPGLPPLPGGLEAPARSRAGRGGRGGGAPGPLLGDARLAARGPGPPRPAAPVGARRAARPRPRALRGRPPLRGGGGARASATSAPGIRAGVVTTPTQFVDGAAYPGGASAEELLRVTPSRATGAGRTARRPLLASARSQKD